MKHLTPLLILSLLTSVYSGYSQSNNEKEKESTELPEKIDAAKPLENTSEETVTKIIRIKGANGEEKVIKQQQVVSKKSNLKLKTESDDKTNVDAVYGPEKVSIKNFGATANEEMYESIPDGDGYIISLINKNGEITAKAKPLSQSKTYYLINMGEKDNCVGYFDEDKNLILETFDSKNNNIISVTYKSK